MKLRAVAGLALSGASPAARRRDDRMTTVPSGDGAARLVPPAVRPGRAVRAQRRRAAGAVLGPAPVGDLATVRLPAGLIRLPAPPGQPGTCRPDLPAPRDRTLRDYLGAETSTATGGSTSGSRSPRGRSGRGAVRVCPVRPRARARRPAARAGADPPAARRAPALRLGRDPALPARRHRPDLRPAAHGRGGRRLDRDRRHPLSRASLPPGNCATSAGATPSSTPKAPSTPSRYA